jgi:hypothetical protein
VAVFIGIVYQPELGKRKLANGHFNFPVLKEACTPPTGERLALLRRFQSTLWSYKRLAVVVGI